MNELIDISVKELFTLESNKFDAYNDLLQNLNGKNVAAGKTAKDIYQLPYCSVSSLKGFMQSPSLPGFISVFKLVFDVDEKEFLKMKATEFYYSFNWLQNQIIELVEGEKRLESEPDENWKLAGIERLNIFGELNTLINIGKQYSKSPQEIEQWTYELVFTLALHNKIDGDINKRYSEIINTPKANKE